MTLIPTSECLGDTFAMPLPQMMVLDSINAAPCPGSYETLTDIIVANSATMECWDEMFRVRGHDTCD